MLLCEKGTRKTTAARTTHGGEKTRQKICSCVHTKLLKEKGYAHFEARCLVFSSPWVVLATVVLPVPFLPSNTERASKWA
jgi:hypothetical protein